MTPEVLGWIASVRSLIEEPGRVIEVGSMNINGSPRPLFSDALGYVGVDSRAGRDVDVVCDAQNLDFPAAAFDTGICCEVIEHASDPAAILRELRRVVKPQGWLILTTPAQAFPIHRFPRDYWRILPDAIEDILLDGCQIVEKYHGQCLCYLAKNA